MKWFYDLKINRKLMTSFILMGIIAAVVGMIGVFNINRLNNLGNELFEVNVVPLADLSLASSSYQLIRVNLRDMVIDRDITARRKYADRIAELTGKLDENLLKFEKSIRTDEMRKRYERVRADHTKDGLVRKKIVALAMEGKTDAAIFEMRSDAAIAAAKSTNEAFESLAEYKIVRAKKKSDDNITAAKTSAVTMIFLSIAGLVLAAAFGMFLSRVISKPLAVAVTAANKIANGDLNVTVQQKSADETGQVLSAMKNMTNSLREMATKINSSTVSLASSSEELSATSDEMNKGAQNLSSQSEQVVTAVTEVSQTIMDMAKNASQAAEASKNASDTALKGKNIVDSTAEDMVQIAQTVQEAAATIEELGRSSAQIGEIVTVINGIADQTNLLALNAAIEAARAGEQGRGFAVVADEVRKLAERTSQATKDIAQRIAAIQAAAGESVDAMKRGSDEVDKGVGLAKQASASLDTIVRVSATAMDMVQRIAAATEEQSAATEEVTQNMENISDIAKSSAASTEQIKVSAEALARLAVGLQETASWFKFNGSAAQGKFDAGPSAAPAASTRMARPDRATAELSSASLAPASYSTKLITWTDGLSVHVPEFDEQHKKLIGIINRMYDALKSGRGKEAVETILPELVDYTKEHFANEEALMQKLNYPGYIDHKAKHTALTNQVLEYVSRMKEGRSTAAVEMMEFLKKWLTSHIKGVDKKYGPHLSKKRAA